LGINNTYTLQFWHDKGVRMPDGKSVPFDGEYQASIVQPGGAGTAAFIVYDNYRVIMKWNKSNYFATAVGMLSDGIKGS
jgi:membrane-bound lytic murein transglycosylase B